MTNPQPETIQSTATAVAAPRPNGVARGMLIVGIVVAAIGGIVMAVASHRRGLAETQDFANSLYHMGPSGGVEAAATLSHFGLGVLILGLVLAICGVTVLAVKRS